MKILSHLRSSLKTVQQASLHPESSVCIIFRVNERKGLELLMVKRSFSALDKHSGQVALPGGKLEAGETSLEAGIRETEEETGLRLQSSEYLGYLPRRPAYQGGLRISGMLLTSHIFCVSHSPTFKLNSSEIHSYRWTELQNFTHNLKYYAKPKRSSMKSPEFKSFLNPSGIISGEFAGVLVKKSDFCDSNDFSDYHLWGATYRVLRSLVGVLPKEEVKTEEKEWVHYNFDWPHKILNPLISHLDLKFPERLSYKSFII